MTLPHWWQAMLCVVASLISSAVPQLGHSSAREPSVFSLVSFRPLSASSLSATEAPTLQCTCAGSLPSSVATSPALLRRSATVNSPSRRGGLGSSPCAAMSLVRVTLATSQARPLASTRLPARSVASDGASGGSGPSNAKT